MPKIKIFLWKICHNALPTRGTLLKRRLNIDAGCPTCLGDIETIEHIFTECQTGKKVWELASQHQWFPIQFSPDGCQQIDEALRRVRSSRNPMLLKKFSFLLWSMWKERNIVVFENKFFDPLRCLIKAKKAFTEWRIQSCLSADYSRRGSSSPPLKPFHLARWNPPPPGFVKINFDGSLSNSSVAGGYVISDWTGKLLQAGTANYGTTSMVVAEARALRDGVSAAIQSGFNSL